MLGVAAKVATPLEALVALIHSHMGEITGFKKTRVRIFREGNRRRAVGGREGDGVRVRLFACGTYELQGVML